MKLPSFAEVAHRLRERFDGASKVIAKNDGKSFMTEGLSIKDPTKQDLVYTDESPDFCKPNTKTGSLGENTKSRDPSVVIYKCQNSSHFRHYRSAEPRMQHHVERRRRMRHSVLHQRIPAQRDFRKVELQVPVHLVLRCGVPDLHWKTRYLHLPIKTLRDGRLCWGFVRCWRVCWVFGKKRTTVQSSKVGKDLNHKLQKQSLGLISRHFWL